jgi:DNA-binding IclR family transcriptional regulator
MDLNMTSTYRYINTLVELGYLEKDAKTKEIRPSILCLLFCANLMRATDHLRLIKDVVDRIHSEKTSASMWPLPWMTPWCASTTGGR